MNEHNSFGSNQELYEDFPIKLKNQSTLTENEIVISFHEDFEIGLVYKNFFFLYINSKFVHAVAEQEIWWFLDEISNNHYSVIQYKEEYPLASYGRLINGYTMGHFLFLPKNAKKPFRVKHLDDVDKIFDINKKPNFITVLWFLVPFIALLIEAQKEAVFINNYLIFKKIRSIN